jgi:polyisoprenoid-binding protein YceI
MHSNGNCLAGFIAFGAFLSPDSFAAAEYTLDPNHTLVTFEMRSLGTTQRGEFSRAAGTVMLDVAAEHGDLEIVIDARSLKASSPAAERFVRGPSMLNTDVHPEIAYRARHVVFSQGRPARIEGELTLLGVTRSVPLDVSHYDCSDEMGQPQRCAIVATASVKRSAFGMTRYRLVASDDVKLAIRAEASRTL